MSFRITPILSKECQSLGWKIVPSQGAGDNLRNLLNKIEKKCNRIKSRSLPIEKEKEIRSTLKKATEELGSSIASLLALNEVSKKEGAQKIEKVLSKKETAQVTREFLSLLKNSENVWAESANYAEAWREIEAEYFYKVSLYQAELYKREKKK
jgi:hypothetical protein